MHKRRAQAHVIAQLADHIGRGKAWKADCAQFGGVELVIGREDGSLVIRAAVGSEERGRHEDEVARVEAVLVVRERQYEVADGHPDCEVRVSMRQYGRDR